MDEDSNPENIEDIIHSSMDGFRIANMIPQPSYLLHQESFSEHDTLTNNSSQNNLSQALLEGEEMVARRIHQIYPHIHVELNTLPRFWSPNCRSKCLDVSEDYLKVVNHGKGSLAKEGGSARANTFIPRQCGIFYFEIKVQNMLSNNGFVGIGVCDSKASLDRMPGYESGSYAYHSDNYFYPGVNQGHTYGSGVSVNDTLGCGLDFVNHTLFFTKNGEHLGIALSEIDTTKSYYPVVGIQGAGEIRETNFGQTPFVFDFKSELNRCRYETVKVITNTPVPLEMSSWMAKHVNNWLEIRGYKKTAKAFKKVTGLKQKHTLMEERRQIMDYIVNGQISEAIELINAICPELLDKEPETYLLLKIQVFVELLVKQQNSNKLSSFTQRNKRSAPSEGETSQTQPKRRVNSGNRQWINESNDGNLSHSLFERSFNGNSKANGSAAPANGTSTSIITEMETQSVPSPPNDVEQPRPSGSPSSINKESASRISTIQMGQQIQAFASKIPNLSSMLKGHMDDAFSIACYNDPGQSTKAYLFTHKYRLHLSKQINAVVIRHIGQNSRCPMEYLIQNGKTLRSQAIANGVAGAVFTGESYNFDVEEDESVNSPTEMAE